MIGKYEDINSQSRLLSTFPVLTRSITHFLLHPSFKHSKVNVATMVNFHLSSQDIELQDGHILVAKCANSDGEYVDAQLDLNYYIGNNDGSFEWGGESM